MIGESPVLIAMVAEAEVVEVPACEAGSSEFKSHGSPQIQSNLAREGS